MSVFTSFAKKIATVGIVYMLGYFELSIAWLIGPVILSVIRDEWKKEKWTSGCAHQYPPEHSIFLVSLRALSMLGELAGGH